MITFFIKSTICLVVLYGFYHFFLRNQKILLFNRFYLIFSLVLSMIIPLIVIPVKSNFTINNTIERFNISTEQLVNSSAISEITTPLLTFQNILTALFIFVSFILITRFALNIFRILRKILLSKKIHNLKTSIVLIREKTLPYSFFKYIFVNQSDFENGKIEPELLMHEEAHCEQYHSIDILIIEIVNIFLWFNPAIWLFRKEILLNHEYYADGKVLTDRDTSDYQHLLLNVLLRNNSNYLVSNFKYSLIKNRIIMMTKSKPNDNAILRKIIGISVFLLLSVALTFSKESVLNTGNSNNANKDWIILPRNEKPELFPIIKGEYIEIPRTFGEKNINPITKDEIVHYGIDIKAKFGTDVMATAGGHVIKASWEDNYGNTIVIDHGDGYQSLYAHLKDLSVKNGDSVTKGQTIGHVGSTGLSTGPHLHFEIRLKGENVNPMKYLK